MDNFIEIPRELIENNQELILCMGIMFINQYALLTNIYKGIRFQGLFPFANRTTKQCYRDLDVITRNYNKTGFSVRCIECDGKFKSIID